RLVVKVGTGVLTQGVGILDPLRVQAIADVLAETRQRVPGVLLVSSGAIGLGMGKLGLGQRPKALDTLQSCAAIGQNLLMNTWAEAFERHGILTAQVLLTREDMRSRKRYGAVKQTLERLLAYGVVPIINENDCVSAEEITFGDNDLLSALVASLSGSQLLCILSTIPGLLDLDNGSQIIPLVEAITPEVEHLARGTQSPTAVGGMASKIEAAKVATGSGAGVFIGNGSEPRVLLDLLDGDNRGTFFMPRKLPVRARKRWLAYFDRPQGSLWVDAGARRALVEEGGSLLARGVREVEGSFEAGAIVAIHGPDGQPFARGQASFSAAEIREIAGQSTADIRPRFAGRQRFEVVHRDALAIR
ncbi:MAG: glutamate 5-kinase, partial [Verrucomicrobiota bacterium]